MAAVQWHPEFHRAGEGTLDDRPLLDDFLAAARAARQTMTSVLKITNPATGEPIADAARRRRRQRRRQGGARARRAAGAGRRGRWPSARLHRGASAPRVVASSRALARDADRARSASRSAQSRNELNGLLGRIDFFLAEVDDDASRDETVFDDGGMRERIAHEPLGVVANISAWNYPYFVGGNVFVPALLTGNAVLYKPSEYATLTGLHIARLLHDAGVPEDVFVPLVGGGEVGAALLEQTVDGVFFTGSYATGARIAAAVGPRMIRLQLELGGKDPTYVCDDADPKAAAESLADGAMYNTGQSCCSVERIYVHEQIHDAFVDAFVATVRRFKVGDPMDEGTYIGAITRAPQLDVLEAQVADAVAKGATLLTGGKRIAGRATGSSRRCFTDVDHRWQLMREESFGPIIGIQKVQRRRRGAGADERHRATA